MQRGSPAPPSLSGWVLGFPLRRKARLPAGGRRNTEKRPQQPALRCSALLFCCRGARFCPNGTDTARARRAGSRRRQRAAQVPPRVTTTQPARVSQAPIHPSLPTPINTGFASGAKAPPEFSHNTPAQIGGGLQTFTSCMNHLLRPSPAPGLHWGRRSNQNHFESRNEARPGSSVTPNPEQKKPYAARRAQLLTS